MPRYFTHAEAERLLPQVETLLREALFHHSEHESASADFRRKLQQIMSNGGMVVDQSSAAKLKDRAQTHAKGLETRFEEISELGIQIKDLHVGLIDFPTLYKGEEVLLCWRLGEGGIGFWHGLSEGFQGRKPVDAEFLENHRGE